MNDTAQHNSPELTDQQVEEFVAQRDRVENEIAALEQQYQDSPDPQVEAVRARLQEARDSINAIIEKAQAGKNITAAELNAAVAKSLLASNEFNELKTRLERVETTLFGVAGDNDRVGLVKRFDLIDDDVAAIESALERSEAGGVVSFGFIEKTKTSINMLGEALQMSAEGKSSRLDTLDTDVAAIKADVEQLKSTSGNAGSFNVGMFLLLVVAGLVLGAVIGYFVGAWVLSAMFGALLGAVVGYGVASGRAKKKSKQNDNPSQPAPAQS